MAANLKYIEKPLHFMRHIATPYYLRFSINMEGHQPALDSFNDLFYSTH